jgi:hypothetical protein
MEEGLTEWGGREVTEVETRGPWLLFAIFSTTIANLFPQTMHLENATSHSLQPPLQLGNGHEGHSRKPVFLS